MRYNLRDDLYQVYNYAQYDIYEDYEYIALLSKANPYSTCTSMPFARHSTSILVHVVLVVIVMNSTATPLRASSPDAHTHVPSSRPSAHLPNPTRRARGPPLPYPRRAGRDGRSSPICSCTCMYREGPGIGADGRRLIQNAQNDLEHTSGTDHSLVKKYEDAVVKLEAIVNDLKHILSVLKTDTPM